MIHAGCRVFHQSRHESFGEGVILEVDERNDNALVDWDSHRVMRATRNLPHTQSHVKLSSLVCVRR